MTSKFSLPQFFRIVATLIIVAPFVAPCLTLSYAQSGNNFSETRFPSGSPEIIEGPYAGSYHCVNQDSEDYGLDLNVLVSDPDGLENIASVEVTAPDGSKYALSDDGQHCDSDPGDGWYGWQCDYLGSVPQVGTYTFTVTDEQGNTATETDVVERVLDFPTGLEPENNAFVSTAAPTFSWNPVAEAVNYAVNVKYDDETVFWSRWGIGSTSVVYNDDEQGPSLEGGNSYLWDVSAFDADGNRSWHGQIFFHYSSQAPIVFKDITEYTGSRRLSDTYGQEEYAIHFIAKVDDPQGIGNISSVTATGPTGDVYELFDDGQHEDDESGDGRFSLWEGGHDSPLPTGTYTIVATDTEGNTGQRDVEIERWLDFPFNFSPAHGSFISDSTPVFSWETDGLTNCHIRVKNAQYDEIWSEYDINATTITYGGPSLVDGETYFWEVGVRDDDSNESFVYSLEFTYTTTPDAPVIVGEPETETRHWGVEDGEHEYGLILRVNVADPQGLDNIDSVTATGPDGTEYPLYDDGVHCDDDAGDGKFSYAYECGSDSSTPHALGIYTYTVVDKQGNSSSKTGELTRFLELPFNVSPQGFVDTLTPTFSWYPVSDATEYGIEVVRADDGQLMWGRWPFSSNSIVYNDDGTGQPLETSTAYRWGVGAWDADGNQSWHHTQIEFMHSDGGPVIVEGPYAGAYHCGNQDGEDFGLDLDIRVEDPDGSHNIVSVTAMDPDGKAYVLSDDGEHCDREAGDGWYALQCDYLDSVPQVGTYTFEITDEQGNAATGTDVVERVLDFPTGLKPESNAFVSTAAPTFSWNPVAEAVNYHVNVKHAEETIFWSRGDIGSTSVVYNDDGQGPPLEEGNSYLWDVSAFDADGNRSWHHHIFFHYSSQAPAIGWSHAGSRHFADVSGNEEYGIHFMASAYDPQGAGDIASVTATGPDGVVYELFDDGQNSDDEANDGVYGLYESGHEAPLPVGTYTFTATDSQGNATQATDELERWVGLPYNLSPTHRSIVSDPAPVFSWQTDGWDDCDIAVRDLNGNEIWSDNEMLGTSVTYDGPPLVDGTSYTWEITVNDDSSNDSFLHSSEFFYTTNPDAPVIFGELETATRHWGVEGGEHQYGLILRLRANDPQGIEDIDSVTATDPDGIDYPLYDDGLHCDDESQDGTFGYAYDCGSDSDTPHTLGIYTYTVVDKQGNSTSKTGELTRFLDLPGNPSPRGFVDTLTPTFTWDPVPDALEYHIAVDLSFNAESMWSRGGIQNNIVVYNDDGTGQDLVPFQPYWWGVGARDADGNESWHHSEIEFIYSDGSPVIAEGPYAGSSHYGDENGDDFWLDLNVRIDDPEGLGNVSSVVVTAPDGSTKFVLNDDGQHCDGEAGDGWYAWQCDSLGSVPQTGEYEFTVTDADGHETVGTDILERTMDIPTGLNPPDSGFVATPTPTFFWDSVANAVNYNMNVQDINGADIWWRHGIEGTSVAFDDDGGASESLIDGQSYLWNVTAFDDDGNAGGHNHILFIYSSSGDAPIIVGDPGTSSMHLGVEGGDHQYGLNLRVAVVDPQGLSNIASVVAVDPDHSTEYLLQDDGQHCDDGPGDGVFSYAYECGAYATEPYDLGEYTFTVTDQQGHSTSKTGTLIRFLDLPGSPSPQGFIDTTTPTLTWTSVPEAVRYNLEVRNPENWEQMWGPGEMDGTSVVYNNDGSGQELVPYTSYVWGVGASDDDGNWSWHHTSIEFMVVSGDGPFIQEGPFARSYHNGDDFGNEMYTVNVEMRLLDPDGLEDIDTVTVEIDGELYHLNDEGDGWFRATVYESDQPAPSSLLGEYLFTATDQSGQVAEGTDSVERVFEDFPLNICPAANSQVDTVTPTFSWDAVADPNVAFYDLWVHGQDGRLLWNRRLSVATTSVVYNDDGQAGEDLQMGESYNWWVEAGDDQGNFGSHWGVRFRVGPPRTIYVDVSNTTGIEDGSLENPFDTIGEGVDVAIDDDTVQVAPGTYPENIDYYGKNIRIVSSDGPENTIIDGSWSGPCVGFWNGEDQTALLRGFTLRHGRNENGAGVSIWRSGPILENLVVVNNFAGNDGGGIHISESQDVVLRNVSIHRNWAGNNGGGIGVWEGQSVALENVVVSDNVSQWSGGIYSHNTDWNIVNSVVVRNRSTRHVGGLKLETDGNTVNIVNSVVFDNVATNLYAHNSGEPATMTVNYSCIQGGQEGLDVSDDLVVDWGTGNIDLHPAFYDPSSDDYSLQSGSPCIDAGDPDASFNDPDGTRNDMGALGGPGGSAYGYIDGPPYVFKEWHVYPHALPPGGQVQLSARVHDALTGVVSVFADIASSDGSIVEAVELFDDGAHGDDQAGDGLYGASWTTPGDPFFYSIGIRATDDQGNAADYQSADELTTQSAVTVTNVRFDDDQSGESNGNGDGVPNPGEFIEIRYDMVYSGGYDRIGVIGLLNLGDPYFHPDRTYWLDNFLGVTILENGVEVAGDDIDCYISSETEDGYTISLLICFFSVLRSPFGYHTFDIHVTGADTTAPLLYEPFSEPGYAHAGTDVTLGVSVVEGGPISSVRAEIYLPDGSLADTVNLAVDSERSQGHGAYVYVGQWTVVGESDFTVEFFAEDPAGNVGQTMVAGEFTSKAPPTSATASVLLVDDDRGNKGVGWRIQSPFDRFYKDALDSLGVSYDVWNTYFYGSPDAAFLSNYAGGTVIWETGNDTDDTLEAEARAALSAYLDAGGALFVSGQGIVLDLDAWSGSFEERQFLNDYLHAEYSEESGLTSLSGIDTDPVSSGLGFDIAGGDGADNFIESSVLNVLDPATPVFHFKEDKPGALKVDTGTYKLVFLAFGFEGIDNAYDRNTLMYRIVKWLSTDGAFLTCDLDYDFDLDLDDAELGLSIATGSADSPNAGPNAFLDGERVTGFDVAYIMQTTAEARTEGPEGFLDIPISSSSPELTLVADKTELAPGDTLMVDIVLEEATGIVGCTLTAAYPTELLELIDGSIFSDFFPTFNEERTGASPSQLVSWKANASSPGKVLFTGTYVDQDHGLGYEFGPQSLFTMEFTVRQDASGPFSISLDETGLCNGPAGWGEDRDNNGAYDSGDEYEDAPVLYKANAVTGDSQFEIALGSFVDNPLKMFRIIPADGDADGDGIPDSKENDDGSCPSFDNPDSDGDGIWDGVEDKDKDGELDDGETDPCDDDSDHDGVSDGDEDENKNGVRDGNELDPLNPDTDGDFCADGLEILFGSGANDPASRMQIICVGTCDLENECHACADSISEALTKTEDGVSVNYLWVRDEEEITDGYVQIGDGHIIVIESGVLTLE